jgi:hypothetical protein
MEQLKFAVRLAEAEAEQQHSARRVLLESCPSSGGNDDQLLALMEQSVVEAEMKRTRAYMSLDQHTRICLFCSPANSN